MLKLKIKDKLVGFIGDPHFGKRFGDVPLHRRGEREKQQREVFLSQLCEPGLDVVIMVGDLFDTFTVENEVLMDVYQMILDAKDKDPCREFIFMSGNHDESRDESLVSSFFILKAMLSETSQIDVITRITDITTTGLDILICPYSPFKTAHEEVLHYATNKYDLIVGHWDTVTFGSSHNLMPMELLKDMTNWVVSGHEHTPYTFYIDELGNKTQKETQVIVNGTGSMIPYSHAEDPHGTLYVTRTVEQVQQELSEDPEAYKDKCLRVVAAVGEEVPSNINCLQFSIKRVDTKPDEKLEVTMEAFSFQKLFYETFAENEVSQEMTDHYWNTYREEATDDNQS